MRRRGFVVGSILVAVSWAGCIGGDDGEGPPEGPGAPGAVGPIPDDVQQAIGAAIGTPIEAFHDHLDPSLHAGSFNVGFVSWSALGVELGTNGFANFVFYDDEDEHLAFIAVDGDTTGGFVIADISDPTAPRPLGRYEIDGNGIQEVRVFPGGRYALMNVQDTPNAGLLLDPDGLQDCGLCLHVVDVSDRTAPVFVSALPVELVGSHNMQIADIGGDTYVFYVGQPLSNAPPGNYVGIARFVEDPTGARLVKVAEYRNTDAATDPKRSFPHDIWVQEHPLTGQEVMYVSHWEGGAITVDVSDPLLPRQLHVERDPAPSDVANIHWFAPEPAARGERLVAWSAPEIGALESGSGVMRSYDMTDPAAFGQIGTWALPGNVTIPGAFIFSPHITDVDFARGLLAVAHYHAGVWVLDISDPARPRALGYYLPHGDPAAPYDGPIWWKKPNFDPEGYLPNVYQARWRDGLLFVSERGTGLYVLRYTGPVPGPLDGVGGAPAGG